MTEIEIIKVENSNEWSEFLNLPWKINKSDPYWVPPLKMSLSQLFNLKKNPFWHSCHSVFFLAKKNGNTIGRICALVYLEEQSKTENTGYFGFLESVNNLEVFNLLLREAENWLAAKGCKKIMGPLNPSIHYELGVLVEGFNSSPYYMLSHNPSYYNQNILSCGFLKEKDFYSYYLASSDYKLSERRKKSMNALKQRKLISIRKVRIHDFKNEIKLLHTIYNDAFKNHWGFQAITFNEFEYMAKDLIQILVDDLVLVLEYNGAPVGFVLALPNMNEVFKKIPNGRLFPFGIFKFLYHKTKIKNVRVITIAILSKYQHLGLGSFLYQEIASRITKKGYDGGEFSWVAEDNIAMNKAAIELGGIVYKRYRVYSKEIKI